MYRRCPQCWKEKSLESFVNGMGFTVKRCSECREKYKNWSKMTDAQKLAASSPRTGLVEDERLMVRLVPRSNNRKTGPIPVTMTSAGTCPQSCAFYSAGCYAEQHLTGHHWRTLSDGRDEGENVMGWKGFCRAVAALPAGQLWRHNEAGDLPGRGVAIDPVRLLELVVANAGRRGFTYTHKPMIMRQWSRAGHGFTKADGAIINRNRAAVVEANRNGFTVNLSADTIAEADALAELGPTVVTLAHDAPIKVNRTTKGRHIVVCPAEYSEKVTCASCGLCAHATRKSIVGFRAHGNHKQMVTTRLRQLPLFQEERT
jgi:hypothetical protein